VYTRESLPLSWAMTQNNLGRALQTLGELKGEKNLTPIRRPPLEKIPRRRIPLLS
jgi:hypothetical protein